MVPSQYQQAIFDWVVSGTGHAVVDAKAGAGKTSTLVESARRAKGPVLMLAFNKHIVDELKPRLVGTSARASTSHSAGRRALTRRYPALRSVDPDERKFHKLFERLYQACVVSEEHALPEAVLQAGETALRAPVVRLCELARLNLATTEAELIDLVGEYGLPIDDDCFDWAIGAAQRLLVRGQKEVAKGSYDFTDMVYIPVVEKLRFDAYPWVFVDEAQDLNRCQQEIAVRSLAPGGRMLVVGDPHQAIYGFAGADHEAFNRMAERLQATRLPLSICYRCPASHIKLAQEIVPAIEARPGAPDGVLEWMSEATVGQAVRPGDLVICRTTAPLLGLCYELIRQRIPAVVRGRDIGDAVISALRQIAKMPGFVWEKFDDFATKWAEERAAAIIKKKHTDASDPAVIAVRDKAEALRVLRETTHALGVDELIGHIEAMFSVKDGAVVLSTVHKAKGLESDRVFILRPELMPHPAAKRAEDMAQEWNLLYVARTRAKQALYLLASGLVPEAVRTAPAAPPVVAEPPTWLATAPDGTVVNLDAGSPYVTTYGLVREGRRPAELAVGERARMVWAMNGGEPKEYVVERTR